MPVVTREIAASFLNGTSRVMLLFDDVSLDIRDLHIRGRQDRTVRSRVTKPPDLLIEHTTGKREIGNVPVTGRGLKLVRTIDVDGREELSTEPGLVLHFEWLDPVRG